MEHSAIKPYSYFNFLKEGKALCEKHPFISCESIGKSVMGKDIFCFTVGIAREYVLLVGGVDGQEHFTSSMLFFFLKELCFALENDLSIEGLRVRRALMGCAVVILPCLNVDGCEISSLGKVGCGNLTDKISALCGGNFKSFNKNARGADLKKDFTLKKEPETAALFSLLQNTAIRHIVFFGKGDNQIIASSTPSCEQRTCRMTDILSASTGYPVSAPEDRSFIETFAKTFDRPSFAILSNAPGTDELKVLYAELRELFMLISIM